MAKDKESLYKERFNRYQKAMNLEIPDKVPILLSISDFAAKYAGYSNQEIYYDLDKNIEATNKLLEDLDFDILKGLPSNWWASLHDAVGAKYLKFAGAELEPSAHFQYIEKEYMLAEDYDDFIDNPTMWLVNNYFPRIFSEQKMSDAYRTKISLMKGAIGLMLQNARVANAWQNWKNKYGICRATTGLLKAPFDTLSDTLRGLNGIMLDLFKRPDKVKSAIQVLVKHNVHYAFSSAKGDFIFPAYIPLHRGSYPFLNPKQWNDFYWPSLKEVIEELWKKGKRTLFYAEGDWTPYLEQIAQLPEKSIIFHIDKTDLDQTISILGKRFCLSGNVPLPLLAYGTPNEVSDYCKRLIDKAAPGGGFIMTTAATIQSDAKIENIMALIETTRTYGKY